MDSVRVPEDMDHPDTVIEVELEAPVLGTRTATKVLGEIGEMVEK